MVVSTTISRVEYSGNASTTVFAYTFRIFADGDLKVYIVDSAGAATLKTITTHYTVSGAGDASGGNVTMVSAPASGETLVIERSVAYTQSTDYVESDSFSANTHETALDRNAMLTQQNQRDIARSMRLAKGTADTVSVELPAPVASHFIKWNSDADALESAIGTADQVTVTDFMATVLDDATAAAAATTLGLGTGNSPQFTAVNVGAASDTTVSRASAGDLNVEGNIVYRAGGTDVPVTDGGTGASTLTDGGVLLGSGTAALTAMAVLGDGEFIVGDGSGDPVAESGATARTSLGLGTGDSPTFTAVTAGQVDVTAQGDVRFQDASGGQYAAFQAPATISSAHTYTLPSALPASSKLLQSTDAGVLTWESVSGVSLSGSTDNTVATVTGANALAGEAKLLFDPPKLTIGSGAEEDPMLVWDGNAQDWYAGIDDTDDDFKIGLGSTAGTTAHIVIDETGAITKPLQPAFHSRNTAKQNNFSGDGTQYTVPFAGTETFDQNADFDGTTFTAPVAGTYLFTYALSMDAIGSSHTNGRVELKTSNRDYRQNRVNPYSVGAADNWALQGSVIADMDASDTAYVTIIVGGGAKTVDLSGDATGGYTYFAGCLLV